MSCSTYPTLAGFQSFVTNVMMIDPAYLPVGAPIIQTAFQVAMDIVNPALCAVPGGTYAYAVYNLAASELINFAPDQGGRTYFAEMRNKLKISAFVPGVIGSSSDAGSGQNLLNPEFMKHFTMENLQSLKDPYGRRYLALAQSYGPSVWGMT